MNNKLFNDSLNTIVDKSIFKDLRLQIDDNYYNSVLNNISNEIDFIIDKLYSNKTIDIDSIYLVGDTIINVYNESLDALNSILDRKKKILNEGVVISIVAFISYVLSFILNSNLCIITILSSLDACFLIKKFYMLSDYYNELMSERLKMDEYFEVLSRKALSKKRILNDEMK